MMSFNNVYKDKTIIITGHTGFKGSWLAAWLRHLGANIVGLSIDVPSEPSNFIASCMNDFVDDNRLDVCDAEAVKNLFVKTQPDFVFHLAAQALVRPSYETPLQTFTTNAIGTANVLDALRFIKKPVTAIMITSDKAYDNVEWVWGYRETDSLGGKDPYSASKGMAELAIRSYVESFFNEDGNQIRIGVARAGNVIGGGDWAEDRIVPDCMSAWADEKVVDIRSPEATRPWQHVLEPLSGYLRLGSELYERPDAHGQAYNFGPPANQNHSVSELIDEMSVYWKNVRWNDTSKDIKHLHEAGLLKLNCDKALFDLTWVPTLVFEETVRMTVQWYKQYYQNNEKSMFDFTILQIEEYMSIAKDRGMAWRKG
jgi:CDP-glucose 4,6-dehydratase